MIYNQNKNSTELEYNVFYDFILKNQNEFITPLLKQVADLNAYIEKLYRIGTIVYWQENQKEIEGIVIGYTDNTPDNTSYITQVVVDKEHRGKGIVQKLLYEYESVCKKKNLSEMWLTTEENNTSAQKAYEKYGFIKKGKNDRGLIIYRKSVGELPLE